MSLRQFRSFFLSLSFPRLLLLTHFGESPMCEIIFGPGGLRAPCVLACAMLSLAIVFTNFRSLFLSFFLSFFSVFYFSPTSGNLPCVKICFPQYFDFLQLAFGHGRLGHLQSLEYLFKKLRDILLF